MSDSDSTPVPVSGKINKPRPDFPLFPHATGYWCKKILGKRYYFGPRWTPGDEAAAHAAADAALEEYNSKAEPLHSGRKPRPDTEGFTVKDAVNHFLTHKKSKLDGGELSPRTWQGYKQAADEVMLFFGKSRLVADLGPDDFEELRKKLAKRLGPHGLGTWIQCIRSLFKYSSDNDLIDKPVRFGTTFKKPSKKTLRKHKAETGAKLFMRCEILRLIDNAVPTLKAMILLGINCGFGNSDCANLPLNAMNLDAGWIDFARPKTGIHRRCHLWTETVAALREALALRPEPKDPENAGLFFITRCGDAWAKDKAENPISDMMSKLVRKLKMNGERKGHGFYVLRHTFRTVADEMKDQPAADFIMGHEVAHMSSVYRETISDERLKAVSDHVRKWLFADEKSSNGSDASTLK